jgi:hypothetical protein
MLNLACIKLISEHLVPQLFIIEIFTSSVEGTPRILFPRSFLSLSHGIDHT